MFIRRSGPQPDTRKTPTGGIKMVTSIKRTLVNCQRLFINVGKKRIRLTHSLKQHPYLRTCVIKILFSI